MFLPGLLMLWQTQEQKGHSRIHQKRAVRKRAATRLRSSVQRILKACHSDASSETYKRIAERFYWKGMVADVRKLAGRQRQSDCTRLATIDSMISVLTLSRVPAYE